jgi:hypothetical protein
VGVERLQVADYLQVTENNTNLIQCDPSKTCQNRAEVYMECTRMLIDIFPLLGEVNLNGFGEGHV